MSWPLPSHFSAILQTPRAAFRDPSLRTCEILKNDAGQPRPWSGSFAVVYKAMFPEGRPPKAIRTFSTESPERRQRYDRIAEYLKGRKVGCLVDFEYCDASIRSSGDGKWYPMIVMDWVEGRTLFDYVGSRCLAGKADSLAKAAHHWRGLVQELAEARIAHGDLHHANVLVTRAGQLKLVDYDGLCVPALVGKRNLEVGVQPYQHPERNEATLLSPALDHFAALLIYVALRALAAGPEMWKKHVQQQDHDKLLFRPEDFREAEASPLRRDLMDSADREVRGLARILFAAAGDRLDQVPSLAELVGPTRLVPRSRRATAANRSDRAQSPPVSPPVLSDRRESGVTPKVVLEVVAGPIQGRRFIIDRHNTFLFGRAHDCHARITEDPLVSRHHFILEAVPPQARIRDLGSRNGTYVNGVRCGGREKREAAEEAASRRYPEVDLKHGDRITVGRTTIEVQVEQQVFPPSPTLDDDAAKSGSPTRPEGRSSSHLPGYELGEEIGKGSLGTVYRAVRIADRRQVAVKIAVPRTATTETERREFLRQIEPLRRLRHPNLVDLPEIGLAGRGFFFVMEFCSSKSLVDWKAQYGGKLSLTQLRPLLTQALRGLDYAHQQGFVHRDLKPQNLLLATCGVGMTLKIADFGLARHFEAAGYSGLTATSGHAVNYGFMPREVLTGFTDCHPSSDLWSLAATFYYLLTGQFPLEFQGRDPIAVILHAPPVPLRQRDPSVPQPVADVIDRALASDLEARYQTAAEMGAAWEQAFLIAGQHLR
jgi:serine/threonine protein kinase